MNAPPSASLPSAPAAAAQENACATCRARDFCLPPGDGLPHQPNSRRTRRIRVGRGAALYTADSPGGAHIYVLRYGSFKHWRADRNGDPVILGFPGIGDFLALEAIGLERHEASAVALEDSEVCEIGYASMRHTARFDPGQSSRRM